MRKVSSFLPFIILSTLCVGIITPLSANEDLLILENCHLDGIRSQVKCGAINVPEDYTKPEGKSISINFAILPAIDHTQNNIPLLFLAGGPGQAAVELGAHLNSSFNEIKKTRDIILIDQRGTGLSQPLQCEDSHSDRLYSLIPEEYPEQETLNCINQLKKSHRLSQYNSENAIRDFDAVRQALGYNKVHLYGGSYGTRAALVYMRLFPQSLESVVLDSVAPIEVPIGLFGASSARSFNLLLEHCAKQLSCNNAFPNLKAEFDIVMKRLADKVVTLTIHHPRLGSPTEFKLSQGKFINILFKQLYGMETRSLLPLVIHQAFLENYQPLVGLISAADEAMNMYVGLTFNIVCNEDMPRITKDMLIEDSNNEFGGNISNLAFKEVCALWPTYQVEESFYHPVTANIPTLILSGNLDPVTPPSNGKKSDLSLPNSNHIIAENSAHIVTSNACCIAMVNDFLNHLDPKKVDNTCLVDVSAESFMTSLNGNL